MGKGTAAKGKQGRSTSHNVCRRCGSHSFHKTKGVCASCGYGNSAKLRSYSWSNA